MTDMVSCTTCGRAVARTDKFCPGCGTSVSDSAETTTGPSGPQTQTPPTQCVKCAAPMGRDDQFCPKCGTPRLEEATLVSHVSLRNSQAARLIALTKGEYEILQQLGHGAMGAVYLAKDVALSRQVAIKVIAPNLLQDETMISRFRLEAQTVASLRHPNIVDVYAVKQSEDLHYFVMEFIDGPTLRTLIKRHAPLDIQVFKGLMFQMGSALSYAHRTGKGVIHRDIKPANIMLDLEGDAFVTDFGISKVAEAQSGLTQTGATIGTPEYMSPEQCRGEELTGASDQYALGIVAYEMLTGSTPFSGSNLTIMMSHTTDRPAPIRDVRADCPPEVAEAVARMLAKRVEDRFPDLDEAVDALGGRHLPYNHPTRARIVQLVTAAEGEAPPVGPTSPPSTGPTTSGTGPRSVTVTGLPARVEPGDTFSLAADVRGDGHVSLTGLGIRWASTDPSIATVEDGVVRAVRVGTVSITATVGGVANAVLVTVAEPAPASVRITPSTITMPRGGRFPLDAEILDTKGQTLEGTVRWSTADADVASVSSAGEVVAHGGGTTTITATAGSATGTASIEVEASAPAGATVITDAAGAAALQELPSTPPPAPPTPKPEPTRRPAARPSAQPAPKKKSPVGAIAAVLLLVGGGAGAWAVLGGGGEEVGGPTAGVEQEPASAPVNGTPSGEAPQTEVAGAGGDEVAGDATTDPPGEEQARGEAAPAGGPQVGAEAANDPPETVQDDPPPTNTEPVTERPTQQQDPPPERPTPTVERTPPAPASLSVRLASPSMLFGDQQSASAIVLAAGGREMPGGSYTLSWRSSDPGVLSVDATGTVRAVGVGSAWIAAAAGRAADSVRVTSTVTLSVSGGDFSLAVGDSRALSASAIGSNGATADPPMAWTSSNSSVAAVSASGQVTAVGAGQARITVSAAGLDAGVTVTVEAAELGPPTAAQVQAEVNAYVALLSSTNTDRINALWGTPNDLHRDLLDLMDERDFSAQLGDLGTPTLRGETAVVRFGATGSYRTNFGNNRSRELTFEAILTHDGSAWRMSSCQLLEMG